MAEKNYTIPINEEFDKYDGCPLCRLHQRFERHSLEYIMGAAMMEPDVRQMTNLTGFCRDHYEKMLAMGNRLSLSLMLQSYLAELEGKLKGPGSAGKKGYANSLAYVTRANDGCFVCERAAQTLTALARNVAYLWQTDASFREKFSKQEFFCLRHATLMLRIAEQELGKNASGFASAVAEVAIKGLQPARDKIDRFCRSFDYRYASDPLGDASQAAEDAIHWILGEKI